MLRTMSAATAQRTQARQSREQTRERIIAAAAELLRTRSYAQLTVDEVMREAGHGRTIFYRHFDDLPDLLARSSREAIEALYAAQSVFADSGQAAQPGAVRHAIEPAVDVYLHHGPLLRGVAEGAMVDPRLAEGHATLRRRFDALAAQAILAIPQADRRALRDVAQTARALNIMNEQYLLDAFGREPRVTAEKAVETLTEIWFAVIRG